jgi:arylsulfatase A-like enzyme
LDYPLTGTSLVPVLKGVAGNYRPKRFTVSEIETGETALLSGPWKIIHRPGESADAFQLYNLQEDPGEQHDRLREAPAAALSLQEQLTRYGEMTSRYRFVAQKQRVSPEQVERLKALGYVQ